ncbi:hypothetical protein FQN50_006917 [Emmonsiellopsis sp. PD_5]|nr:hypothetical protein FQN50_006917 [Emmonsiellopsis sp. PD_5]
MSPPADFSIVLSEPHTCYVPGDKLTGNIIIDSRKDIEVFEIGIEFRGAEALRYNNQRRGNILFRYTSTLFTGPYTLRAGRHSYPFDFEFPATTDPPETPTVAPGFRQEAVHTLPPSTNHKRPGVTYNFDALIGYELFAFVKKPRTMLGGGKILLEQQMELPFWPTDANADKYDAPYEGYTYEMKVPCYPAAGPEKEFAKMEEPVYLDVNNGGVNHHRGGGRLSRLFSSFKPDSSPSSPLPDPNIPTVPLEISLKIPTHFLRDSHNPLFFSVNPPPDTKINPLSLPPLKIISLIVQLQTTIHTPCLETTVYGAKPGISKINQTLLSILEPERGGSQYQQQEPLTIPSNGTPLAVNLFHDPKTQFDEIQPSFSTWNIMRLHELTVVCRLQCEGGGQTFQIDKGEIGVGIVPPVGRPGVVGKG